MLKIGLIESTSEAFPGALMSRDRRVDLEIVAELAKEVGLRVIETYRVIKQEHYYTGEISLIDGAKMYEFQRFLEMNKLKPVVQLEGLLHVRRNMMKNELEGNIKAMEISKFLGAETVIVFAYGSRSRAFFRMDKEVAKRLMVMQLCKLADAANSFGLRIALALGCSMLCGILPWTYDWKPIIEIVENARKKTGLDNIGVVLDVERPQLLHENIIEVTKALAPYVFHGYFKDMFLEDGVWKGCLPREGVTPWKEIVNILKDAKCNAVLSLDSLEIIFPDYTYLPRSKVKEYIIKAFEYMKSLDIQW